MRTKRAKMASTPIQFTEEQYANGDFIMEEEGIKYFSEYVRKAVDFYTEQNYPQLCKKKAY